MTVDKARLCAFLDERAKQRSTDDATQLAIASVYDGLATRVRRGDFDEEAR